MTVVSPSQSNAGDTIEAADVNTPVNQLAATINGNLDATNLADGGITNSKIADGTIALAKMATRTRTLIPMVKGSTHGYAGGVWFPDGVLASASWEWVVPDDYVSGDFTITVCFRAGATAGNIKWRKDSFRFRIGAALQSIDSNVTSTQANSGAVTQTYTATITASNFTAGDVLRLDLQRQGTDAADTCPENFDCDGVYVSYTGRA